MRVVSIHDKKIRISRNGNSIENLERDGEWRSVYKAGFFSDFSDLEVRGERLYANSSIGKIWSSNAGKSWHLA